MARIAVVGSGALGLFYGGLFALAGHDVRFLARRERERLARHGLVIETTATPEIAAARGGATVHLPPAAFRVCATAAECAVDGAPDWALVTLKTTALDAAPALLAPLLGPATRVVAMCNGLGVEERLAAAVPLDATRVFGAMAHVCISRLDDGRIRHLGFGKLLLGHLRDDAAEADALRSLVASAGIDAYATGCLRESRWRKLVWNLAFNGLAVAHDRATDAILAAPATRAEAVALMRETCAVANADLAAAGRPERIDTDAWVAENLARTEAMGAYLPSTLIDRRAGRALELDAMFAEPVRRAHTLRVPAPGLERILALVSACDVGGVR